MSACESEAWRTAGIVSVEQQHRKGYSVEPTPHFGKYDHLAIRLNPSCTKRLNPKLVTVRTVNTQTDTCARGICRACRWVFTNQKTICLPKEGTGCRMLLFFFSLVKAPFLFNADTKYGFFFCEPMFTQDVSDLHSLEPRIKPSTNCRCAEWQLTGPPCYRSGFGFMHTGLEKQYLVPVSDTVDSLVFLPPRLSSGSSKPPSESPWTALECTLGCFSWITVLLSTLHTLASRLRNWDLRPTQFLHVYRYFNFFLIGTVLWSCKHTMIIT